MMTPNRGGSFHLFRLAGINVYLHWSWFVVAAIEISARRKDYTFAVWNLLEYLGLFLIVLLHEFGHSLACRQVGGTADQIVLWPLGGVAYVNPPQRPGATLWSIAAGPLVNVVLTPIFVALFLVGNRMDWAHLIPNVYNFVTALCFINVILLVFNILPIYPLDGGQILRSLLWFFMGKARSLMVASSIGFVGVLAIVAFAVWQSSIWIGIMAAFVFMNCLQGFNYARALARLEKIPRRAGYSCPSCHTAPPIGPFWVCAHCQNPFDTFLNGTVCPNCNTVYDTTRCLDCGRSNPLPDWRVASSAPPPLPPRIG